MEPKIIGKGTAPTEAWELTTLEESSAVLGDMAIMIVATSTQDGMPTNGSTVTAGASGIMATKTGDGKRVAWQERQDPGEGLHQRLQEGQGTQLLGRVCR